MPVFGVEKYIAACLDSIIAQTFGDIEIIIVNDGSRDASEQIIGEYISRYGDLIRYFKKENGGLSDARNYGLSKAEGEYIAFIDSDDSIAPDFCEKMYYKAKEKDFDIVFCDTKFVFENKEKEDFAVSSGVEKDVFSREEAKKYYVSFFPAAWNKLYKREFLEESKVLFKKGVWFEDVEFCHRLYPHIKSIGTVNEALYYYLQRKGSVTNKSDMRLFDYLINFESIVLYYKENGFFEEYKAELEFAALRYLYATFLKRCAALDDKSFAKARKEAKKFLISHFPECKKNPYLKKSGIKGYYLRYCDIFSDKLLKKILK